MKAQRSHHADEVELRLILHPPLIRLFDSADLVGHLRSPLICTFDVGSYDQPWKTSMKTSGLARFGSQ